MLLERDGLLDALEGARRRAAAGRGNTVLVQGEAGIGKTSLLREFADRAGKDTRVFWGWCEALFTPRPLGPLYDMGRSLSPAVGALLNEAATPERLFPALLDALQEAPGTTVLVFEDMHWADNATLDLIKYLGRRIPLLKTMLVLTARSDEVGSDHPLAYVLGDLPAGSVSRMTLGPLSADAISELAAQSGRSGPELHRITGGNPFFITELLASGESESIRLPHSVRDAVWSRLSRLSAGEREVLEMMSIVPGSVEIGLIQALLGPEAEDLVDRCVARGLLRRDDDGDLTFRHELARQATLDRLSPSFQRTLHAKVEAALAALPSADTMEGLARRAHHAAGAEDGARVLDLAPKAAANASRLGAHQQAASFLAAALDYADKAPTEVAAQFHEDWAYEASLALRDYDAIIAAHHRAIEIWRALGATEKVSLNLRRLSRLHWRRGEGEQAVHFSDLAVEEAEKIAPGPELAMAYSTRSQLNMLHYRFDEAIDWGRRAIKLADKLGELETRVHALNNVGTAELFGSRPGGRTHMEESLSLALQHGFHDHAARAYTNFAEFAVIFKDFDLAERLLSEGITFAARNDLDATTQYLLGRQAELRMEQGLFREAETIAQGVVRIERLPVVMHLPALTVLGRVRVRLEDGGGIELLHQALAEGLPTGEPQRIVPVRFGLIEAAWLAGDIETAREQLAEIASFDLKNLRSWDLGEFAVWWRRCGIKKKLPALPGTLPLARAAEVGGDALKAADEWERLGLPYEAALSLLQVDTVEAVTRAITMLDAIEAKTAGDLARKQARDLGVDTKPATKPRRGPYGASRHHPLGLTTNEQQVLALIAEGKSNKEVARSLSRSPRTVEHQVSAVLGKFNATNRMEVLLRLRAEPWLLSSAGAHHGEM